MERSLKLKSKRKKSEAVFSGKFYLVLYSEWKEGTWGLVSY